MTKTPKLTVTRTGENCYSVKSDIFLSDCTYWQHTAMVLDGSRLRPATGSMDFGYSPKIQLGPKSQAKIDALAIGDSVEL